jgi:hypothetical protein
MHGIHLGVKEPHRRQFMHSSYRHCKIVAASGLAPPDRASRLSRRFATIKLPFPPRPRPSLHSTLYFILSPFSPLPPSLTDQAAQPPEFSPRDVVGLTWSPLSIPPPNRLAALIRPFLEPNFPRRWSDSDVGVDARPG